MDPITNLARQQELAHELLDLDEIIEASGNTDQDAIAAAGVLGHELAELALALDTWRRAGGFDPYTALEQYNELRDRAQEFADLFEATAHACNLPLDDSPGGVLVEIGSQMASLMLELPPAVDPEPEEATS